VWEYHEANAGFATTPTQLGPMITMVAAAFGGVSGGAGESGMIYNGVDAGITGFGVGGNLGSDRPAAYLNYILFDKNYKVLDVGWQPAPSTTFTRQQIYLPQITVKEEGYVFVYLSYENDSTTPVYFDDMKVTHTKGNIIQYNEYYPFGMQTANSWTRENTTGNNFLANGGTEINTTTSLYDLTFRNYDPVLGRMNGVDPMADKYASLTPYNYAFNDPVYNSDPSGADPMDYRYHKEVAMQNAASYHGNIHSSNDLSALSGFFRNGLSDGATQFSGNFLPMNGSLYDWGPIGKFIKSLWNKAGPDGTAAGIWNGSETVVRPHEGMSYAVTLMYENGNVVAVSAASGRHGKNGGFYSHTGGMVKLMGDSQQGGSCCGAAFAGVAIPLGGAGAGAALLAEAIPPLASVIGTAIVLDAAETAAANRTFITYTKRHANGSVYVGRASGWGNAFTVLNNRDRNHHMNALGYGPAVLDRSLQGFRGIQGTGMGFGTAAAAYSAIRGREQQLIDFYGGVGSPLVGNSIRGVSAHNPLGRVYHEAANVAFGQVAPYTGF
jgi:RHS repeat-associated protein